MLLYDYHLTKKLRIKYYYHENRKIHKNKQESRIGV
jgi:hypothetical protein